MYKLDYFALSLGDRNVAIPSCIRRRLFSRAGTARLAGDDECETLVRPQLLDLMCGTKCHETLTRHTILRSGEMTSVREGGEIA